MHHRSALSHIGKKRGQHRKHHSHGTQNGHRIHSHGHGGHGGHGPHGGQHFDSIYKNYRQKLGEFPLTSVYPEANLATDRGRDQIHNTANSGLKADQDPIQSGTPIKAGVDLGRCVGCGKCQRACPTGAIDFDGAAITIDTQLCIGCGQCVDRCRKSALFLMDGQDIISIQ